MMMDLPRPTSSGQSDPSKRCINFGADTPSMNIICVKCRGRLTEESVVRITRIQDGKELVPDTYCGPCAKAHGHGKEIPREG